MRKNTDALRDFDGRSRAAAPSALTFELHQAQHRARQLGVEFLYTELQMAEAFLALAETTSNAASSRRNLENAGKALDAIGRFIERLNPQAEQRQLLARRASGLRARLSSSGWRLQGADGCSGLASQSISAGARCD